MADCYDSEIKWHKNLTVLPVISAAAVERFISTENVVKETTIRGYKFFVESYIHNVEGWSMLYKCHAHLSSVGVGKNTTGPTGATGFTDPSGVHQPPFSYRYHRPHGATGQTTGFKWNGVGLFCVVTVFDSSV